MATEWAAALLDWYRREGRDLPWRQTRDPYRVWVSEIMLQQTRVVAAIPYYERFMARFPTLQALAEAPLDDVLKAWEGLGYYSRARNLHAAARQVSDLGEFPRSACELRKLKGIGDYTSAAIASICFGEPEPVIDGNVIRVSSRLLGLAEDLTRPKAKRALRQQLLPAIQENCANAFNQAIMEIGALVCTPRSPACLSCPCRTWCVAFEEGTVEQLPNLPKRPPSPEREKVAVCLATDQGVLMHQRPTDGFLGGLWELPTAADQTSLSEALAALGIALQRSEELQAVVHVYTHFRLTLSVLQGFAEFAAVAKPHRWVPVDELEDLACDRATRKALAVALGAPAQRTTR